MATDRDDKIRARAYEIWEAEGRPYGRTHLHWLQAMAEVDGREAAAGDQHPGMMGDGTEEQNLNQPGAPAARITEEDVKDAFSGKPGA